MNEAAKITRSDRDNYQNEAAYGTEVHFNLEKLIKLRRTRNIDLEAERSFIISGDENRDVPYGQEGFTSH